MIHSTGQSGILWSPWYRNFSDRWRRVKSVPLLAPLGAPQRSLLIKPAGG